MLRNSRVCLQLRTVAVCIPQLFSIHEWRLSRRPFTAPETLKFLNSHSLLCRPHCVNVPVLEALCRLLGALGRGGDEMEADLDELPCSSAVALSGRGDRERWWACICSLTLLKKPSRSFVGDSIGVPGPDGVDADAFPFPFPSACVSGIREQATSS